MDIRNFFGAKKKVKPSSSEPSVGNAKKKRQKSTKPKDEVIEIDVDGDDKSNDNASSITPSKRKQSPQQGDGDQKTEVSAEQYFSTTKPPPSKKKKPRSAAKVMEEKVSRVEVVDNDDEVEFVASSTPISRGSKRSSKRSLAIVDSDDEEEEFTVTKSPAKPPKKKAKTPSPSKPSKKQSPKKKSPRKAATKPKRDDPLEPTLSIESFSVDDASPECLLGYTFVFTGVLAGMGREESSDYVKTLGGRVTSAVSGRTDYLVVGEQLEDGRPYTEGTKYKKALELGVRVVKGEEELYGLCKQYSDKIKKDLPDNTTSTQSPTASSTPKQATQPSSQPESTPKPASTTKSVSANPYAKRPGSTSAGNPYAKKPASNPYAAKKRESVSGDLKPVGDGSMLWADKYAPQSTREILGNQECVKKLTSWVARWESQFNNAKAQGKSFSSPGGPWKAALLSGPPGIGKTTTATLVAKEAGRDVLELNASDVRSKKALAEKLGDVTGSRVLNFANTNARSGKKDPPAKKRCIIMDEVDGMGSGDRSGISELIKMIKGSMVPIICICNDRQSQKIKSLVPYCLDLRYRRPTKSVIARRAVRVGQQEGMRIEQNAIEAVAESCGNDIRQVLNCLQMWASRKGPNSSMTYKDVKERERSINKDEILRVSIFDATKMIVEGRRGLAAGDQKAERASLYKRSDAFFVDYSLMGLNVHQNYLKVMVGEYGKMKQSNDSSKTQKFLERMHEGTLAMSDYAVAEQAIRGGDQNWSLLPFSGMLVVKAGSHAGGQQGGFLPGFPAFTDWMGKNSTRGKKNRLLQELGHHMNYRVSADSREMRLNYLPVMRSRLLNLLRDENGARVTEAIQLMDEYGLDRDDVFEKLDEFRMDPKAKTFGDIESKQKAAFTRAYNEGIHKSQALVAEQGAGKRSKKAKPKDSEEQDGEGAAEQSEEEEELDVEQVKALFKSTQKKKRGSKKAGKGGKGRKSK